MTEYYKLREDLSVDFCGRKLFRIECIKEIEDVKVGDLGGYIEKKENLSGNAWVYGNAKIYGDARVSDNARICGDAQVYDSAMVCNNAQVYDNALVGDKALVCNNAQVYDNAQVCENARVFDNSRIYGNAQICGDALVYGNAQVYGEALVCGDKIKRYEDVCNITNQRYNITITPKHIKIGCQYHSKTAWFRFRDSEIEKMGGEKAVKWWKIWKPVLKAICEENKND